MGTNLLVRLSVLAVLVAAFPHDSNALPSNDLERDREPVVLEGASLPTLLGAHASRIVGFSYDAAWTQIPVQVDERAVVDFGTVYGIDPTGYTFLAYTDTSTFTGPDPDPAFDYDDELLMMAKDAGARSSATMEPEGTIAGTGVEIALMHPVSANVAYVYLFEGNGSLDPGAGQQRVAYEFNLLSGPYKTTYQTMSGPNPEDSSASTSAYSVHFSDRWIRDETRVTMDGASGVDVLDRHKNLFAPGNCSRSENTFSNGEGAFIMNRQGPLRALRGYVGANSGPTTYRIHAFYEEREDVITTLRVHPISGVIDYFDYSPEATGMVYTNDLNPGGVVIDGVPDAVATGMVGWEMVTGIHGTAAILPWILTDIPDFTYTSYYSDDLTPPEIQCTGDPHEYGASGIWVDHSIPNTDPALGAHYKFEAARVMAYGPPGQGLDFALAFASEVADPLSVSVAPYTPATFVSSHPSAHAEYDAFAFTFAPNPVAQDASVRFSVIEPGPVRVRLYNVSGRLAATLVDGVWGVGEHELTLDLSGLATGIYFATASGPGGVNGTSRVAVLR